MRFCPAPWFCLLTLPLQTAKFCPGPPSLGTERLCGVGTNAVPRGSVVVLRRILLRLIFVVVALAIAAGFFVPSISAAPVQAWDAQSATEGTQKEAAAVARDHAVVAQSRAQRFAHARMAPGAGANAASAPASAQAQALTEARSQHMLMGAARAQRLAESAAVVAGQGMVSRSAAASAFGVGPGFDGLRAAARTASLTTAWQAVGPMQVNTAAYGLVTGRVTSVAIDPADATGNTVYLGTTGGGVWKSTNAAGTASGVVFAPLTDNLEAFSANAGSIGKASLSIGAVSLQPGGTGVVLAGTGDPNDATDSYYGVGLLRSADSGTTWTLVQGSNDGVAGNHLFLGEGFAGFAWSATTPNLVVAALSSSAEGALVNASAAGASARGLYYSTDAGATWQMSTIQDGGQRVQAPSDSFSATYEGNAATTVTWNPLRQRFYAAIRFHGYYESADGQTWTRMVNQPGVGLTATSCPARQGTTGLENCPIFRGALAVQLVSGDLFALTVDGRNVDQGLYQDLCASPNGTSCASSTVLWANRLTSTPMESGGGVIAQGDYNLELAAVPAATSLSLNDTLVFAGTSEIFRCRLSDGCSLRNTTNVTTGCAAPAKVSPSQHAIAWQSNSGNSAAPLLLFGNDGGLWRSLDGVNQQQTPCSADDAAHFDNLNGGLGSLAEVIGLSTHPTDGGIGLVALGALGSAASTASSSYAGFQSVWTQMGTGESGSVAIDQGNPLNWMVQSGGGVALHGCNKGNACTAADFAGPPTIGAAQVNGDPSLSDPPFLLDPALNSNVLIGTCRAFRGPTSGGSAWSGSNAISAPLSGPANSVCSGQNGSIRSLAAGGAAQLTSASQTSGSPVLYAGLAGTLDGGSNAFGGHFYKASAGNVANGGTSWTDVTSGSVTNDPGHNGRFNPYSFDVSSISVDPSDATGLTVYATVMGFHTPSVYRSTDGAASWTSVTANLPDAPTSAVVVDPNNPKVVYVAMDTGVYVTADVTGCTAPNAQCWSIYGTALPNAPVTSLVASVAFAVPGSQDNGVLRAGTYGRGVWQIPLLTAGQVLLPSAMLSPSTLSFGGQNIGYTGATQTVTVTNTGNASLSLSRVTVSTQWVETDNCAGATLAVNGTCTVQVRFSPSATGAQSGTLQVYGNMLGGYATASLSGSGTGQATVLVSPPVITFPDIAVHATSTAQTVTVTNNGTLAATLQIPTLTGDYRLGTNGCAATLAASASCSFIVLFMPVTSGVRTGLLTLTDNTGTHSVTLNGNGVAGDATVTPAFLLFPSTPLNQVSADRTVTLLNSGNGPLQVGAVTISGDFSETNTCANTLLGAGRSCAISIRFTPSASGARTGTMVITTNAKGDATSTSVVALNGGGQSAFSIVLTPASVNFGSVFVGATSPVQNITISNTGSGGGALGSATVTGEYRIAANTCGRLLPTQTGCTVSITFAPTAAGPRTGSFSMTDDAGTQTATLTGVGAQAAMDALSPTSLVFGTTTVNTNSASQSVLLKNDGDVALTLVAAKITSGSFTAVNGCGTSLAAHTSCAIAVTFSPKSVGSVTGTLEVDDVQRAQIVPLSGTAKAGTGISVAPSTLTFVATGVGNATSAQMVTLTNNGTTALQLGMVTASGDFGLTAGTGTCAAGATLAVGAACTMQVAFVPKSSGARTGTLTVTSNTATQSVLLNGTGVDFSFASNGPASVTVANGKGAAFPLLLTPAVNTPQPVTFACTGAPANSTCKVVSTYSDLSGTSTVTVTVLTGTVSGALQLNVASAARDDSCGLDTRGMARDTAIWPAGELGRGGDLSRDGLTCRGLGGVGTRNRSVDRGASSRISGGATSLSWVAMLLLPCGLLAFSSSERLRVHCGTPRLLLLLMMSLALGGCGSGRNTAGTGTGSGSGGGGATATTPAGSYSMVVSATSAGLTKQVPLTLVVTAQ